MEPGSTLALGVLTNFVTDGLKRQLQNLAPSLGENMFCISNDLALQDRFKKAMELSFVKLQNQHPEYASPGNQWIVSTLEDEGFIHAFWTQFTEEQSQLSEVEVQKLFFGVSEAFQQQAKFDITTFVCHLDKSIRSTLVQEVPEVAQLLLSRDLHNQIEVLTDINKDYFKEMNQKLNTLLAHLHSRAQKPKNKLLIFTNQSAEVSPLPEGSRIVHGYNPLFVGRDDDLKTIARYFRGQAKNLKKTPRGYEGQIKPVKKAITGLGGLGKTQLANAFVHRFGNRFPGGVYWISFADPINVAKEVVECGRAEGVVLAFMAHDDAVRATQKAWEDGQPRLLIFDNCEDETLLEEWCPKTGWCRILITSRRQQWSPGLGVSVLSLDKLDHDDGLELLLQLNPRLKEDDPNLPKIIDRLGGLPLALHLAGSFLSSYPSISTTNYLDELGQGIDHPSLEGRGATRSPTGHDLHIGMTFGLSFQKLDDKIPCDGSALALLARAACFSPGEPIPRDLLFATLGTGSMLDKEDAALRLINLGLLEPVTDWGMRLHRLLVDFVKSVLPLEEALGDVENTLLDQANRLNNQSDHRSLSLWQGHLKWVSDHADINSERCGSLCNELGFHLHETADYAHAMPYYEKALEIWTRVLGEDHPKTATSLNNLGTLLQAMGDVEEAQPYLEKALEIRKRVLGEEHPDTATSLNNLGSLLRVMGDLEKAKPYYEKAHEIRKRVLREDHPETAYSLNNMGTLLQAMGDVEEAQPYYEKALEIWTRVLGEDHPKTAASLNNMGSLLRAKGDLEKAKPYYERALEIMKRILGEEHQHTRIVRANMETLISKLNDQS